MKTINNIIHVWLVYSEIHVILFILSYVRPYVTPTEHAHSLRKYRDKTDEEYKGEENGWEITCIMGMGGSTLGHDGDVGSQWGAHPSFVVMDDKDLGCVWERAGQLGSTTKEWTYLPLAAWARRRGWTTLSTHPRSFMMTSIRKSGKKGACAQGWGALVQEMRWLMGRQAHLGILGPQRGTPVRLSVMICEGAQHTPKT
jgi:hypothetical protein